LNSNFDRFDFEIYKEKEMADFRKVSVLAALVLLLGLGMTASAQVTTGTFTCSASAAVPPTVRAEGYTELVGDIILDCTGGVPTMAGIAMPQVNFTVYFNTNVTSRIYDTTTGASEVLMLVDEPNTSTNYWVATNNSYGAFQTCSSIYGCSMTGLSTTSGIASTVEPYGGATVSGTTTTYRPNVFRGIVSGYTIQFIGIPVDAPGSSGHRIFRFTNIRLNASAVSSSVSSTPGTLQAQVSATGNTYVGFSNTSFVVGYVQSGMTFAQRAPRDATSTSNTSTSIQFPQCTSVSRTTTYGTFLMQWTENFPTAFKKRAYDSTTAGTSPSTAQNASGTSYNTESGFYQISNWVVGTVATYPSSVGLADSGTRLKVVFNNIPTGASVYVSNNLFLTGTGVSGMNSGNVATNGFVGQLLTAETGIVGPQSASYTDALCAGSNVTCPAPYGTSLGAATLATYTSNYQLTVTNGTATAVYEVLVANALASDAYNAMVWFAYSANPASNSPAAGTATVTGGFAPTPTGLGVSATTAATTSTTLSMPRFVEGSTTRNTFIVYTCRTNLLFPFVTNQSGFDTGLAIANTSSDPYGTSAQSGTCTLYSYGDNAPASITTSTVKAGNVYVNLASTAMPNFQGYIIATCQFQFAHGFAFISDYGARSLAMGYLALVIPEPGLSSRSASFPSTTSGVGEGLGN